MMAKYYDDHLAAAEKDISSRNFCNLVDAAVMLYEEEQRSLLLLEKAKSKFHTRILSEEEEESDKRIFHLFPRKRRGSVATIRNPEQNHQNLNGASTSSSVATRRNPEQSHQNLNGASTSSSVVTRRNPKQSHQNLNGVSTSSSVPVDSNTRHPYQCFMISDYHLAAPENMCNLGDAAARSDGDKNLKENPNATRRLSEEEDEGEDEDEEDEEEEEEEDEEEEKDEEEETDKRNFHLPRKQRTSVEKPVPQENLNGASTSRKRRAVQKRKPSGGKAKKAKVAPFSWKERATPECLTQMMNHMKGPQGLYEITEGPRLIFEKKLTKTDVKPEQSRLLMPLKTLIRNDFLTPVELGIIDGKKGVGAVLVDQKNVTWGFILVGRNMKKKSGKVTLNYALICGWNYIVEGNGLKEDDDISIWSFRCQEVVCFALVLPPSPDMATE